MATDTARLAELMASNDLTGESRLYRYSLPDFLSPTERPGILEITANGDPSEAIVDVYGQGHIELALHAGPGLAFARRPDNEWTSGERTCLELRLQDALDQGGRLYPVESVTTEEVWYVTLPAGKVRVRVIDESSSDS